MRPTSRAAGILETRRIDRAPEVRFVRVLCVWFTQAEWREGVGTRVLFEALRIVNSEPGSRPVRLVHAGGFGRGAGPDRSYRN